MTKWAGVIGEIRRRTLEDVRAGLSVDRPFGFYFVDASDDVRGFVDPLLPEKDATRLVTSLPGRDVIFIRDALTCAAKFAHVLQSCRGNARRGAATWAVVDSYHASYLGARALCAMFGVIPYSLDRRSFLIDFRPELGSVDEMRGYRRLNKGVEDPIRILAPEKKLLDQADFWKVAKRIFELAQIGEDEERRARWRYLSDTCDVSPGRFRNQIIYDATSWIWRDDICVVDRCCEFGLDYTRSRIREVPEEMNFLDTLVDELYAALTELSGEISFDLMGLPPGLAPPTRDHVLTS